MEPLVAARQVVDDLFPGAVAAFLGGSVLTSRRTSTSDLDIVVVLDALDTAYRRTIRADDWLVELWVHTPASLRHYWTRDLARRRPTMLRICAEGRILVGAALSEALQTQAREMLAAGPPVLSAAELESDRYRLTNLMDDLEGCRDPHELAYLAAETLTSASALALNSAGQWLGSGKWLARHLAELDAGLAARLVTGCRKTSSTGETDELRSAISEVLERAGGAVRDGFDSRKG